MTPSTSPAERRRREIERFRGREVTHPELGRQILERLVEDLGELAVVETMPKFEGRQITMVLVPGRAAEAGAEAESDDDSGPQTGAPQAAALDEDEMTEELATADPVAAEDEKSADPFPADEE